MSVLNPYLVALWHPVLKEPSDGDLRRVGRCSNIFEPTVPGCALRWLRPVLRPERLGLEPGIGLQ